MRANWKRQAEVECLAKLTLEGEVGHLRRRVKELEEALTAAVPMHTSKCRMEMGDSIEMCDCWCGLRRKALHD